MASGYLKVKACHIQQGNGWQQLYELGITNFEVMVMFRNIVAGWFASVSSSYNDFIKALLQGDVKAMNVYMNRVALNTFSFFDTGKILSWVRSWLDCGVRKPLYYYIQQGKRLWKI